MTPTARILRSVSAAALALGLVGAAGLTGAPAHATALPKPRGEEWWFTAWDIQNQVWQQTRGQGVTVAVVDSGVNAKLPELRGVVLPGADARHGGTTDGHTDIYAKPGGHGTGMAALIASQGGPSGLVGIAPAVKILPVTIDGFPTSISAGIQYAADHGAQVINVSQGPSYPGGCPGDVQAAVSHAISKGAVVVASMGNEGNTTNDTDFPASCAGVLGVGAVNNQKLAWTDTQRQPYVSVAAPGVEVGILTREGRFDNTVSGTSQAAALASGAVALVRSKFPRLSPREVVQKIINTTVDAGPRGHDNMTGSGVIVPIRALTMDVPKNAPNPTFQRLDAWRAQNPQLAKPSGAASAAPSAKAEKSGSGSGVGVGIVIAVIVVVIAVAVVVILLARRRRGGPRPVGPQPFPGGPPPYQGPPMPYGPPQGPGMGSQAEPRQGPPPSFQAPGDRPQGPPPTFHPPADPGSPQR